MRRPAPNILFFSKISEAFLNDLGPIQSVILLWLIFYIIDYIIAKFIIFYISLIVFITYEIYLLMIVYIF